MDADGVLALYDRHARELLGFFTRRTRDPHLALDLVSETFLAAFEHRDQCRAESDGEAAAWLYRIAANRLAAHYRRGAIERRATERLAAALRAPDTDELSAIERLAAADDGGALTEALAGPVRGPARRGPRAGARRTFLRGGVTRARRQPAGGAGPGEPRSARAAARGGRRSGRE